MAREFCPGTNPGTKVVSYGFVRRAEWFAGGKLNVGFNCRPAPAATGQPDRL